MLSAQLLIDFQKTARREDRLNKLREKRGSFLENRKERRELKRERRQEKRQGPSRGQGIGNGRGSFTR